MVVLIAFVLSFFLKAPPLRTTSALQEAADEHAAEQAELTRDVQRAADSMGALIEPGIDVDEFERPAQPTNR